MKMGINKKIGQGILIGICFITYVFLVLNVLGSRLDLSWSFLAT